VGAGRVHACDDEIGTDVALVAEEMLLEQRHACHNAGLAAGGESMQFEVRGNDGGRELGIRGGSGAGAPNLRGDVVELLTVLSRR
jgi:hypothetical protein